MRVSLWLFLFCYLCATASFAQDATANYKGIFPLLPGAEKIQ